MITSEIISSIPQIAPLPSKSATRLLDLGMLHYEASLAGSAERYGRGVTSHTIHVWWARRPHSSMRALVFASLCKDLSSEASALLKKIGVAPVIPQRTISKARSAIESQYLHPPRLLDMFGGGGTIPMEACNLGAETYSIDANQLSVFIQLCNLVYSQGHPSSEISKIVKASGTKILNQLVEETARLFPLREKVLIGYSQGGPCGYIWTYLMTCPSCGYRFYLSKRPWLSRKKGKRIALIVEDGEERQTVKLCDVEDKYKNSLVWGGANGTVQCPRCNAEHSGVDIKCCEDEIVALVRLSNRGGKEFSLPTADAMPPLSELKEIENSLLKELEVSLPHSQLPKWSGIVNPALYGVETHADFLNLRQRIVLLLLVKSLRAEYHHLRTEHGETSARYVICALSSFIDQMVDWNCRFSMWIAQNEQVGRAFCGPGVSMLWDYVETDPFLNGPANLWKKLQRIVAGIKFIHQYPHLASVQQGYAQELPFPDDFFDAIVTDPPYYDNLYYNVLADFFYAWKRLLLNSVDPDLFKSPETDSHRELVASKYRSGTPEKAHSDYCDQIRLALSEAERVLKPDGIFSFLYTHSSLKGWEAILKGYRATHLLITSVQPLSIERRQRPRAMTSEAINTSIAFIAHKSEASKQKATLSSIKPKLEEICDNLAPNLRRFGWSERDVAMAVFANGVGMLANVESVEDCDTDAEALRVIESIVKQKLPTFSIRDRESL